MARNLQEMPKMGLNTGNLSEVELLRFLTLNLCDFDPGLEAGSRLAIKSNLVIYLVPYSIAFKTHKWVTALKANRIGSNKA